MKRQHLLLGAILTAILAAGCHDDKGACVSSLDQPWCSPDGTERHYCAGHQWQTESCGNNAICAYTGDGAACVEGKKADFKCDQKGRRFCTSNNIAQVCQTDGTWIFVACASNETCQDGECVQTGPGQTQPQETEGIFAQRCSTDGKSVETVDTQGNVKSETCLSLVGFETSCKTYQNGHVGCEMPDSCGAVFSEDCNCVNDDLLLGCDMDFVIPKPFERSCGQTGQVCRRIHGKSACMDTCAAADDKAISCLTKDGVTYASRCVAADKGNVVETGISLCLDDHTSVTCSQNAPQEKACLTGESCIDEIGTCIEICGASEAGKVKCDSNGDMTQCQQIGGVYGYVSVGKRHCVADVLVSCQKDSADIYQVKETDCRTYMHNGELLECSCQMDYQYPDMDVCIPVTKGDPCNGEKSSGHCDGSTLVYCVEEDDALVRSDCSKNRDGFTSCSEYAHFADCRKPCSTAGKSTCSMAADGASYYVNVCVPSDSDSSLTLVEGDAICFGDILYQCNSDGESVQTDCSVNGGRCDISRCVYPACSQNQAPLCFSDNALLTCQIEDNGLVTGSTVQTVSCDKDGNCMKCNDGEIVRYSR